MNKSNIRNLLRNEFSKCLQLNTKTMRVVDCYRKGDIVVTTNEIGECVLVSRQDEDHKILKVIWEKK